MSKLIKLFAIQIYIQKLSNESLTALVRYKISGLLERNEFKIEDDYKDCGGII